MAQGCLPSPVPLHLKSDITNNTQPCTFGNRIYRNAFSFFFLWKPQVFYAAMFTWPRINRDAVPHSTDRWDILRLFVSSSFPAADDNPFEPSPTSRPAVITVIEALLQHLRWTGKPLEWSCQGSLAQDIITEQLDVYSYSITLLPMCTQLLTKCNKCGVDMSCTRMFFQFIPTLRISTM